MGLRPGKPTTADPLRDAFGGVFVQSIEAPARCLTRLPGAAACLPGTPQFPVRRAPTCVTANSIRKRTMRNSLFTRLVPVVAVAVFSANASAQDFGSAGISIAGEGRTSTSLVAGDRAGIFTKSALVAPKGAKGVGFQAASMRASLDEVSSTASAVVVSGYYGLTENFSIGASLPYARMSLDIGGEGVSESGLADAGVFGRFQAYRSQTGATKFALGAEVTLPTGGDEFGSEDASYAVNGALSHRAGNWNLHIVPGVSLVKDLEAGINFNVAAVRALSQRLSWSAELLSQFGGAFKDVPDAEGDKDIDLATGIRYGLSSHSAMDLGLRYNVSTNIEPKPTMVGAYLGFNWAF